MRNLVISAVIILSFSINIAAQENQIQQTSLSAGGASQIIADTSIYKQLGKENFFILGQTDAKTYYKNSAGASWGTFGVGLLSPLVALIPAIATSAKVPKVQNLNYPSADLFNNEEYKRGYTSKAKKLKQGRVWGAWGASLGLAIIVQGIKNSKE
jgi:hypothetical protein